MVASDLHYISPALTDHGAYYNRMIEASDGKVMAYAEELAEAFVEQAIRQSPDILIISGDLTFNGARQSHLDLSAKLQRISDAGICVLVMPGNHDIENEMAAKFQGDSYQLVESMTAEQFAAIYQAFGYSEALERDETSLSYIYQASDTLRILMVDSNTIRSPGTVTEQTLNWIEQQLKTAAAQGVRVVAVSHQNLLEHNRIFVDGYVMGDHDKLLRLYETYGVICNLSGHLHIQHIAQSENGLPDIATSSLAVSPNQYGVLTLNGTHAEYSTVMVDVSAWARQTGAEQPDLLDFAAYSESFFWQTSYQQAMAELSDQTDKEHMAAYFSDVNTAYFAGRMDLVKPDAELQTAWREEGSFLLLYLQSVFEGTLKNYTQYQFEC